MNHYELHVYCLFQDAAIKKVLMRSWGVFNVTDYERFDEEFASRTGTYRCVGPSSWQFNGGWYVNKSCIFVSVLNRLIF
jgi:hypothetical protein